MLMSANDLASWDDAQLVAACRRGEAAAWPVLVKRFERLIFTVPRRAGLSAEQAADVFQTVFMRLHEHIDGLAQPDRLQAWLVTTARRETLRLLREGQRTVALASLPAAGDDGSEAEAVEALVDPDPLPADLLEDLQLRHLVRLALERLAEPCRSLLDLLYCRDEPLPYAEISQQLGMPTGSIGPTRARCLGKLRLLMEAAG